VAKKPALRVATADDAKRITKKNLTLDEAVASGTYLEILVAQRRQMIKDLADVNGPAKAALHRQIALHSKEIAALEAAEAEERAEDAGREVEDEAFDAEAL